MDTLTVLLRSKFLPDFLAGILVNFEIAAIALGFGLVLGFLLGLAHFRRGVGGTLAGLAIGLMRAAPTFVIIFFLLNVLPRRDSLSAVMVVALALVPYAAAYIADSTVDALRHFRSGSVLASLLVLPNIARAFFVLVMSSSVGAAIGVHEGIAIVLREAEKMPSFGSTLMLFAVGIVCFGVPLQAGFAVIRAVQTRLGQAALRAVPEAPATLGRRQGRVQSRA
jgi:hypothetical protein